ncbi:hypothetical protein M2405_000992 [Rhodococcus erythropolis]|uniref:hypothetical protein n=1 Tax=Rhodococcus TaxID=1827 RepID=UPI001071F172|nr:MULTISPECIES: hypothetical protein [Rhodococcus]MCS4252716.1 hypothetical protein [Rhodococcus erythropolis]MCW2428842.1 hypothetical protein [Rhodococcus erythropolis]MDV8015578.1 hypothetical protein [Rhodococcus sp. IEGM 1241]
MHLAISNVKHEKHYFSTTWHFGCKYLTQQDMSKSPQITAPTRNISTFHNPLNSPIRKWVNLEKNFRTRRLRKILLVKLSIQDHKAEEVATRMTRSFPASKRRHPHTWWAFGGDNEPLATQSQALSPTF